MWGKRAREKQTVPHQFLTLVIIFNIRHRGCTYTYNRGMQNWNVRNLYRVSRKDIVQWTLKALHIKPSKDNMQEKSEYESLYDSAGNEGYMVCILVVVNLPLQTILELYSVNWRCSFFFFNDTKQVLSTNFLFPSKNGCKFRFHNR